MIKHNEVYNFDGEHYHVIAKYKPKIYPEFDVIHYELSSLHNPSSENLIKTETELTQSAEKVRNPEFTEYIVYNANKLVAIAEEIESAKKNGNLDLLEEKLNQFDNRRSDLKQRFNSISQD